ncbi:hypothetical protein BDR26DRAFT_867332 [Obelidium mucronatum]|nr:hypothetical protein BDR26DRAFT_867332 [Obelidium mucronatum]
MTKSKSKQAPQQQRKNSLTPVSTTTTTTHEEPTAPGKTSMSISTLMRGRSQRQDSLEAATATSSTLSRSESTTSRPPASGTTPIPPIRTKSKLPSFSTAAASKKDSASAASAAAEPLSIAEIDMTLDMLRSPSLKRKITNKQSAASLHSRTSNGSLKGNVGTNNGVVANNNGVLRVAPPVIPSLGEVAMDMLRTATAKRPNRTSFNEALRGEPGLAESGHAWFLSPGVKRNEDGSVAAGSTLSRVGE